MPPATAPLPSTRPPALVVSARLAQAPARDRLQLLDAVIAVDEEGVILAVEEAGTTAAAALAASAGTHEVAPDRALLLPGLVDLHVHAPQWPQLGTGLDLPLERWLFEHTFPLEARFADLEFARPVWADLVAGLLAHGTTTAVYHATQDVAASTALAEAAATGGQRAYVGRVAMDHPEGTVEWYRDASAAGGIAASARSVLEVRAVDAAHGGRGLVRPIVTPRFSPACTDELLAGLGALAADTGALVQTHVSESDWAHAYNLERFGVTDSTALDRFGLLRHGTVLAHANHVTADDATLIAARGSGIAHCPLSNAYFANAVLPVRRLVGAGVRMGLGTDVAGGASPSLLHTAHEAVTVSRIRNDGTDERRPAADRGDAGASIDTTYAFWLATLGGAEVLGAPVGLLAPGRRFDAVLVDTASRRGSLRTWPGLDSRERVFEKVVRLASPPDIVRVWVDGREVLRA
ncbi:MAG TPA: amidohydrolase family protein [Candidatus Limnocylindrales bacterium]|nr:amidohydrolase family protein [Candidatus Limnocylindrales bacterium]